ncbi:MAG: hypothetical protein PHE17_08050 [Thiothrix sp.]|nr:hypothetical protein [Thiothrix sp.]MDD5392952.1 hypothetical protein [Thiothrix sp.]
MRQYHSAAAEKSLIRQPHVPAGCVAIPESTTGKQSKKEGIQNNYGVTL